MPCYSLEGYVYDIQDKPKRLTHLGRVYRSVRYHDQHEDSMQAQFYGLVKRYFWHSLKKWWQM